VRSSIRAGSWGGEAGWDAKERTSNVDGFDGSASEEEVLRVSGGCDEALAAVWGVVLAGLSRATADSAAARC
jgi:hypothetical protein